MQWLSNGNASPLLDALSYFQLFYESQLAVRQRLFLEFSRQPAGHRVIVRLASVLSAIRHAELVVRREVRVDTEFDYCGIARDRHALDVERRAAAHERERR